MSEDASKRLSVIIDYRRRRKEAGEPVWEDVESEPFSDSYLERIAVPGGWLYRSQFVDDDHKPTMVAMCFVPWPPEG